MRLRWPREARDHAPGSVPRGAGTSRRKPGEIHWAIYRRNLDGSGSATICPMPGGSPLEAGLRGRSRWRIETEFETEKSDVGLDEYETRTWAGITMWPCACWAELFC